MEEDRQPTREGHKLDSYLLNAPLVPWAMQERPYLAPGRPPTALRSEHGPVVLGIPVAVATKERITRLAYSHAQGRLHAIRSDSPGVREAAEAVLQRAYDDPTLREWLSSVPDLQLRWAAIRGAINVVSYALSGVWSVRVRES